MGFNVGVIGCGRWGSRHIDTLLKLKIEGFVGKIFVCDVNPLRLKNLSENVDGVFADWRDMLQATDLDLVSIATPNSSHASLGISILEEGLNVLVEKPIGTSLAEVKRLLEAAEVSTGLLFSGYLLHHHSGFQYAKDLIQSQNIGKVKSIRYTKYSARKKPEKADVIQNLASHAFSIIPELLENKQSPLFTVAALLENHKPAPLVSADQAKLHLSYSGGKRLHAVDVEIHVGWGQENMSKLTIEGAKENIRIHFQRHESVEKGALRSGYAWVQTPHSNPPLEQQYRSILANPSSNNKDISTHLRTALLLDKATSLAQQWYQENAEN